MLQCKGSAFPFLPKFRCGFPRTTSGFAPLEERLIAAVESLDNILCRLRPELFPVPIFRHTLQFCQMCLHPVCRNVLSADPVVPFLQSKKMVPDLACDLDHLIEVLRTICCVQLIFIGFTHSDDQGTHLCSYY